MIPGRLPEPPRGAAADTDMSGQRPEPCPQLDGLGSLTAQTASALTTPYSDTRGAITDTQLAPLASLWLPMPYHQTLKPAVANSSTSHDKESTLFRRNNVRASQSQITRSGYTATTHVAGVTQSKPSATKAPTKEFEFIGIHKPSGKPDNGASVQVKRHVMRKYHENRRIPSAANFETSSGDPTRQLHIGPHDAALNCVHPLKLVYDDFDPSRQESAGALDAFAVREWNGLAGSSSLVSFQTTSNLESAPFSRRLVICASCNKLLTQASPVCGGLLKVPLHEGPRGRYITGFFDPFASTVVPRSPRLHELLHYCEFPIFLSTRLWQYD